MGTVGGAPSESRSRLPTAEKIGNWLRASVLANLPKGKVSCFEATSRGNVLYSGTFGKVISIRNHLFLGTSSIQLFHRHDRNEMGN